MAFTPSDILFCKQVEKLTADLRSLTDIVKKDKRDYIDSLAQEAEEAAYHGNMKDLYMTTKKLAGKYSRPERPVKDKQGQNITDSEQLLERWAEHFEELLNRPAPENPPDIAEAEIDIDVDCHPPTREEIIRAIKKMKNGKAAGLDGIPAEALKADVETTAGMLLPLFVKIWEQEETPTYWKDGHIIKLPKKGDLSSQSGPQPELDIKVPVILLANGLN